MSKEAMKLCEELGRIRSILSAVTGFEDDDQQYVDDARDAIQKLIEALAKPDFWEGYVPEPVKPAQQKPLFKPLIDLHPGLDEELKAVDAPAQQEPDYWLGFGLQAHTERPFEGATPLYTAPPQRKPDYKAFRDWAREEGHDTAYTINSDNGKYIPLSPMTADLWSAWQAAHGITKGNT